MSRALAGLERMLAARGQTVTIRRPGSPPLEAICRAWVKTTGDQPLPGEAAQAGGQRERTVILSPTPLAAAGISLPLRATDRVVINGTECAVVTCTLHRLGDGVVRIDLTVTG